MNARILDGRMLAELIPQLKTYKKKTLIEAVQVPYDFTIRQDDDEAARSTGGPVISGEITAPAGSWLARSADGGGWYPIASDKFELMYEYEAAD
jgi:hypothetical protein